MKSTIVALLLGAVIATPICSAANRVWYRPVFHTEEASIIQLVERIPEEPRQERVKSPDTAEIIHQAEFYLSCMECELPEELIPIFETAGERFGVEPELLEAIAWRESRYKPGATNGDCKGIMQVSVTWHTGRMNDLGYSDIFDPEANINTAAHYIRELLDKHEDVYRMLMEYNGDKGTAISQYAKDIVKVAEALKVTHKKAPVTSANITGASSV